MNDKLSWEGIQLIWVVLGLVGAALGIGSMPRMTKQQLWFALGSGVACAALAPGAIPEFIAWWRVAPVVPLPGMIANVLAFVFGIGGMFVVPTLIKIFKAVQEDPLGWLDYLRGRGSKPANPTPPMDEGSKEIKP